MTLVLGACVKVVAAGLSGVSDVNAWLHAFCGGQFVALAIVEILPLAEAERPKRKGILNNIFDKVSRSSAMCSFTTNGV